MPLSSSLFSAFKLSFSTYLQCDSLNSTLFESASMSKGIMLSLNSDPESDLLLSIHVPFPITGVLLFEIFMSASTVRIKYA